MPLQREHRRRRARRPIFGARAAVPLAFLGALALHPAAVSAQDGTAPNPEAQAAADALADTTVEDAGGADLANGLAVVMGTSPCAPDRPCLPCFQCHQIEGEGQAAPVFPRLTGQMAGYLYAQLFNFASGVRPSDVMHDVAAALTQEQMRDVAAYYAAAVVEQPDAAAAAQAVEAPDPALVEMGAALAAVGDADRGIQACGNCHGPQGAGIPPDYPYLAGQYADYLTAELQAFRAGRRGGDVLGVMTGIAARLSDEEIAAVAAYYAAIRPSRPVPQNGFAGNFEIDALVPPADDAGDAP